MNALPNDLLTFTSLETFKTKLKTHFLTYIAVIAKIIMYHIG